MGEEIHETLRDLTHSVGRMEGQLDMLVDEMKQRNIRDDDRHSGFDKRLRKVEGRQYWYAGAAAALAVVAEKFAPGLFGHLRS